MIHFVVLQKTSRFKFNVADIADQQRRRIHIVTRAVNGLTLSTEQRGMFESIVHVNEWSLADLRAAVSTLLAEHGADNLRLATQDEYSMMFAAIIREAFDLPGARPDQIRRFTDKPTMKAFVGNSGIAIPKFAQVQTTEGTSHAEASRLLAEVGLPAFVKQVDGTCAEHSLRVDTRTELETWIDATPNASRFEVDTFLTGTLVHVDSIIQNGRVVHTQLTRDTFPSAEATGDKPIGAITLPHVGKFAERMKAFNLQCLEALKPLVDGTTHLEFFWTPNDEFIFLEIAARSPGADCPAQYELNSGINFQSIYFQIHFDLDPVVLAQPGPYVAWLWYAPLDGRAGAFEEPRLESEYRLTRSIELGELSSSTDDTRVRAARIMLWNHDFDALERDFNLLRLDYQPVTYVL
jgi:hypothetical protein